VDLKPEGMTVFTPKGASIELPEGAIVLDFAFAVHTELGLHCIGARINDKVVSLDEPVPHGATIQILKSPNQEPSPEWLNMVKTIKAKQELRKWMKTSIIIQSRSLGKEIWTRELRLLKIEKDKRPKDEDILQYFGKTSLNEFFERIGQGELPLQDIHRFLNGGNDISKETAALRFYPKFGKDMDNTLTDEMPLMIGHETSLLIHFASCCGPVPGDKIVGVMRPQIGIEVHKSDCPCLKDLPTDQRLPVDWGSDVTKPFTTHLTIETDSRKNLPLSILMVLKDENLALDRMSIASAQYTGRIRMEFKAFRKDQVDAIVTKIRQVEGVRGVEKA